jgi:5-methylcytosine-specific restriction endonuclease McrA
MAPMTYWEKLKDPRWQRRRLEILQRENFTCEACLGTDTTLHVHHGYYEKGKDPWDYDSATLHCLCEGCHEDTKHELMEIQYRMALLNPIDLHAVLRAIWQVAKDKPNSKNLTMKYEEVEFVVE